MCEGPCRREPAGARRAVEHEPMHRSVSAFDFGSFWAVPLRKVRASSKLPSVSILRVFSFQDSSEGFFPLPCQLLAFVEKEL